MRGLEPAAMLLVQLTDLEGRNVAFSGLPARISPELLALCDGSRKLALRPFAFPTSGFCCRAPRLLYIHSKLIGCAMFGDLLDFGLDQRSWPFGWTADSADELNGFGFSQR